MLGDMPVGEPFDVHLQRSSQLAVGLLEHQRCQGKAPHSFATIEVRRAPPSRMRLQLEFQRCWAFSLSVSMVMSRQWRQRGIGLTLRLYTWTWT